MLHNIIAIIICLALLPRFAHAAPDESQILRLQDDVDGNMRVVVFSDGLCIWGGVGNVGAVGRGTVEIVGDGIWKLKIKTPSFTIIVMGDPAKDTGTGTLKYPPFGIFDISDETAN